MRILSLLLGCAAVSACAPSDAPLEGDVARLAVDQAAVPRSTMTAQIVGTPTPGGTFQVVVAGSDARARVDVAGSNGVALVNGGDCAPFWGGNCLDITPGTSGYFLIATGTSNLFGNITFNVNVPPNTNPGTYVLQAVQRQPAGSGNESNAVTFQVTVPGLCADDVYENNDNFASATPLSGNLDAVACPNDLDFYEIFVPSGATLGVEAFTNLADGDLDMELFDTTFSPPLVVDQALTGRATEELYWYNSGPDKTMTVRVYSHVDPDDDGIPYELAPIVLVPGPCTDDAFEDDDTPATARTGGAGAYTGNACTGDFDYFAVPVTAGDQVNAQLTVDNGFGDVDVVIVNAAGTVLSGGPADTATYLATSTGTVYVRAFLQSDDVTGGGNTYGLNISIISSGPCPVDSFESNDSRTAVDNISQDLAPGVYTGLGACIGDSDWYRFYLNAGEVVQYSILFAHADSDVDIEVYRQGTTQRVDVEQSSTDNENGDYAATQSAFHYFRVYVYPSTDGPPTTGGATYDLVFDVN